MLAVDDRFWAKVSRGTQDECWPWIPAKPGEYGRFYLEGRVILAHRYALESRLGRKLAARALHHCDNPPCCNPRHLFEGTQRDNMHDAAAKGRIVLPPTAGELNSQAKLSTADVLSIREQHALGATQTDLGRQFNVSQSTISLIIIGKTWRPTS